MFFTTLIQAQDLEEPTGQLEDTEVVIEKQLNIKLPQAKRIFHKLPVLGRSVGEENLTYKTKKYSYKPNLEPLQLKPNEYLNDSLQLPFQNYVKLGYGNYNAPLFETMIAKQDDKNRKFSGFFQHDSYGNGPVLEEKSAQGLNMLKLSADLPYTKGDLKIGAQWRRDISHFYGGADENTDVDSIQQSNNLVKFITGWSNAGRDSKVGYNTDLSINHFSDNHDISETEVLLNGGANFKLESNLSFNVNTQLSTSSLGIGVEKQNRNYLNVSPMFQYQVERLILRAGVNLNYQDDSLYQASATVLPSISMSYAINALIGIELGVDSEVEKTLYAHHKFINRFIQGSPVFHVKGNNYFLKANGRFNAFTVGLGMNYTQYDYLPVYVNTVNDFSRFSIQPVENVDLININLSFEEVFNDELILSGKMDYFKYITEGQIDIYHKPDFQGDLSLQFNVSDKVGLRSSFMLQSGRKFRRVDATTGSLALITDMRLSAWYQIDRKVKIFTDLSNLLSNKGEYYYLYEGRRAGARIGFSYLF